MNAEPNLEKWRWLCYFQSLFGLETFIAPVLVIFYIQYAGFSFSQYAMLMSYIFVFSWLFQIPTGAIADKYGRKGALIFGNAIYIFAMLSLVVYRNDTPIVLTAVLFSLGSSLSTGAFQSMMFSAYAARGREEDFNAVNARGNSLALLGGAIGAAAGGFLASVSLALPMVIDIVILSVTSIILLVAIDRMPNEASVGKPSMRGIAIDAFRTALGSRSLFTSILIAAVIFAGVRTGFNLYQPLLTASGVDLRQLGIIFAGFSIFSAGLAYAYSKVRHEILNGSVVLILIVAAFVASSIIMVGEPGTPAIIFAILCHQVIRAVYPSYSAYLVNINIAAGSNSRTTILSLAALLRSLAAALFSYGMAFAADRYSGGSIFGVVSLVSASLIMIFGFWSVHESQSKKPTSASPRG